jgi:hypothetical protein
MSLWYLPYKRLAWKNKNGGGNQTFVNCFGGIPPEGNQWYAQRKSWIVNGQRYKSIYDCHRGLISGSLLFEDDAEKAVMFSATGGFLDDYMQWCRRVTGKTPFPPALN